MIFYIALALLAIGIYGLIAHNNLVKQLISLTIVETAMNIFIIAMGYINNMEAPIYSPFAPNAQFVDPLPQALVLTAIVIGVGTLAFGAILLVKIKEKYVTLEPENVKEVIK